MDSAMLFGTNGIRGVVNEELNADMVTKVELIKQVEGFNVSTIDGAKIWFENKSTILVLADGTNPVFRLYAQAKTAERAAQLVEEYSSKLEKALKTL